MQRQHLFSFGRPGERRECAFAHPGAQDVPATEIATAEETTPLLSVACRGLTLPARCRRGNSEWVAAGRCDVVLMQPVCSGVGRVAQAPSG